VRANESAILVTINQLRPIVVRFAVPADQLPGCSADWGGRSGSWRSQPTTRRRP
jgi:hypothetical protein